jgi:glycosyltransferase involved in cell wall biosynthesis
MVELSEALADVPDSDFSFELIAWCGRINKRHFRPPSTLDNRWYWPIPGLTTRRYDLVHTLDTRLPWPMPGRMVCTLHDLFSLILDGDASARFREKKVRSYERIAKYANAVIVPSESVRADFLSRFEFPPEAVFVVPHGINPRFFYDGPSKAGHQDRSPYVLAYGGWRKNLARTISAFEISGLADGYRLVIIGQLDDDARSALNSGSSSERVVTLGRVPDDVIPEIYRDASALCFPSLSEGFGFPVLEGLAAGTPVVTSCVGATAEIGREYAELVDPLSEADIARGMVRAIERSPEQRAAARNYARCFTWGRAARQTLAVYSYVLQRQ